MTLSENYKFEFPHIGFDADLFVGNTLINLYVKCGLLDCGRKLLEEMPERSSVSWTI